ncbi:MAG: nucleotidyltransferase family protein [Bacteroidia bacterium]|nr:nucleotidyltransferase family protein [Bacteroidia bacterium]
MSKRAIILAGGQGVRLRPYTLTLPKPMMPLGDYPILEIIIKQLASHGFDHLTLAVNHQAEVIQQYFENGERWKVKIDYSLEQTPLGTLGPVLQVPDLPEHFLVMNADVLTDFPFSDCWDEHLAKHSDLTLGVCKREYQSDYGLVKLNEAGQMIAFEEKPTRVEWVSMGIYLVSRNAIERCVAGERLGFDYLFRQMLDVGNPPTIFQHEGYWLDIGSPDDYQKASETFSKKKESFLQDIG